MVAPSIETRIRAHGKRPARRWARCQAADIPLSSIRTVTVGVGLKPTLLTLPIGLGKRSRARAISRLHRRWGLSPRPENVRRPTYVTGRQGIIYGVSAAAATALSNPRERWRRARRR